MITSGCSPSLRCHDAAFRGSDWSGFINTLHFSVTQGAGERRKQNLRVERLSEANANVLAAMLFGKLVTSGYQEDGQIGTHFPHEIS
ncbi:hypothetical protein D3C71_2042110 [compost metagenome]